MNKIYSFHENKRNIIFLVLIKTPSITSVQWLYPLPTKNYHGNYSYDDTDDMSRIRNVHDNDNSDTDDSNDTNEAARKVITYNLAALVRTV